MGGGGEGRSPQFVITDTKTGFAAVIPLKLKPLITEKKILDQANGLRVPLLIEQYPL